MQPACQICAHFRLLIAAVAACSICKLYLHLAIRDDRGATEASAPGIQEILYHATTAIFPVSEQILLSPFSGRTLPSASSGQALSVAFDFALDLDSDFDPDREGHDVSVVSVPPCHPEKAESHAERATPDEGPMQLATISPNDVSSSQMSFRTGESLP